MEIILVLRISDLYGRPEGGTQFRLVAHLDRIVMDGRRSQYVQNNNIMSIIYIIHNTAVCSETFNYMRTRLWNLFFTSRSKVTFFVVIPVATKQTKRYSAAVCSEFLRTVLQYMSYINSYILVNENITDNLFNLIFTITFEIFLNKKIE